MWRSIVGGIKRSRLRGLAEKAELNAARADVLQDFLRFGQQGCPADRYIVTFYGHAYGPMGLFFDADARQRSANTLRLNDLASSIEGIEGKAAVVIFRDCFMNTLETAYQLRRAAEFMLASQSVVPVAGVWPWLQFMTALMPSAVSGDVGRALAVQLAHFLDEPSNRGPFEDVPYSLIDLDEAETIVKPLKALVNALDAARADAKRSAACAKALEGARIGYPDDPVESWRSGAARCADAVRQAAGDRCGSGRRAGAGAGRGRARAAGAMAPLAEEVVSGDQSLLSAREAARHRAVVHHVGQCGRCGEGCGILRETGALRSDRLAPDRVEPARARVDGRSRRRVLIVSAS